MTIALYMDVHIPQAITTQLRRRNIDILTAQEDNTIELPDDHNFLNEAPLLDEFSLPMTSDFGHSLKAGNEKTNPSAV